MPNIGDGVTTVIDLMAKHSSQALVRVQGKDLKPELLRLEWIGPDLCEVYFIVTDVHMGQFYRWSSEDDFCWAPTQQSVFDSDALVVVAAKLAELSGKPWR